MGWLDRWVIDLALALLCFCGLAVVVKSDDALITFCGSLIAAFAAIAFAFLLGLPSFPS